jgi:hypothetical protein
MMWDDTWNATGNNKYAQITCERDFKHHLERWKAKVSFKGDYYSVPGLHPTQAEAMKAGKAYCDRQGWPRPR